MATATGEDNEEASPVILHEREGPRNVPLHAKQDGTTSLDGSLRRGGWQQRGGAPVDGAGRRWPGELPRGLGGLHDPLTRETCSLSELPPRAVKRKNRGGWQRVCQWRGTVSDKGGWG
jgi:hypothetical protein